MAFWGDRSHNELCGVLKDYLVMREDVACPTPAGILSLGEALTCLSNTSALRRSGFARLNLAVTICIPTPQSPELRDGTRWRQHAGPKARDFEDFWSRTISDDAAPLLIQVKRNATEARPAAAPPKSNRCRCRTTGNACRSNARGEWLSINPVNDHYLDRNCVKRCVSQRTGFQIRRCFNLGPLLFSSGRKRGPIAKSPIPTACRSEFHNRRNKEP